MYLVPIKLHGRHCMDCFSCMGWFWILTSIAILNSETVGIGFRHCFWISVNSKYFTRFHAYAHKNNMWILDLRNHSHNYGNDFSVSAAMGWPTERRTRGLACVVAEKLLWQGAIRHSLDASHLDDLYPVGYSTGSWQMVTGLYVRYCISFLDISFRGVS